MADLFLEWNSDFKKSASGGLELVNGDDFARQRLMRRCCTAVAGYVWHPEYGAGLPQKIGDPWSVEYIQAIVSSQVAMEASVAPNPPPKTAAAEIIPGLISVDISYTDNKTGVAVNFQLNF
jgi:hypothetical protein